MGRRWAGRGARSPRRARRALGRREAAGGASREDGRAAPASRAPARREPVRGRRGENTNKQTTHNKQSGQRAAPSPAAPAPKAPARPQPAQPLPQRRCARPWPTDSARCCSASGYPGRSCPHPQLPGPRRAAAHSPAPRSSCGGAPRVLPMMRSLPRYGPPAAPRAPPPRSSRSGRCQGLCSPRSGCFSSSSRPERLQRLPGLPQFPRSAPREVGGCGSSAGGRCRRRGRRAAGIGAFGLCNRGPRTGAGDKARFPPPPTRLCRSRRRTGAAGGRLPSRTRPPTALTAPVRLHLPGVSGSSPLPAPKLVRCRQPGVNAAAGGGESPALPPPSSPFKYNLLTLGLVLIKAAAAAACDPGACHREIKFKS